MFTLPITERELYDNATNSFYQIKSQTLTLEHSLVSLSKWEQKWRKAFLNDKEEITEEELRDYIRCMTITQNVDPIVFLSLTPEEISKVVEYIKSPSTATVIKKSPNSKKSSRIITSELIYYWMISLNIPVEFQKWHLNRLITLIEVCNIENSPKKNMTTAEMLAERRAINAQRRMANKSKG